MLNTCAHRGAAYFLTKACQFSTCASSRACADNTTGYGCQCKLLPTHLHRVSAAGHKTVTAIECRRRNMAHVPPYSTAKPPESAPVGHPSTTHKSTTACRVSTSAEHQSPNLGTGNSPTPRVGGPQSSSSFSCTCICITNYFFSLTDKGSFSLCDLTTRAQCTQFR